MSFLKRKKMENNALEKLSNKIVDVIYKTFTKKYYLVKISQSRKGHIYLMAREKRERLLGEQKNALHRKIFDMSSSVFNWYCGKYEF